MARMAWDKELQAAVDRQELGAGQWGLTLHVLVLESGMPAHSMVFPSRSLYTFLQSLEEMSFTSEHIRFEGKVTVGRRVLASAMEGTGSGEAEGLDQDQGSKGRGQGSGFLGLRGEGWAGFPPPGSLTIWAGCGAPSRDSARCPWGFTV